MPPYRQPLASPADRPSETVDLVAAESARSGVPETVSPAIRDPRPFQRCACVATLHVPGDAEGHCTNAAMHRGLCGPCLPYGLVPR